MLCESCRHYNIASHPRSPPPTPAPPSAGLHDDDDDLHTATFTFASRLPHMHRQSSCFSSRSSDGAVGAPPPRHIHCHLVEQCILAAQRNKIVYCPVDGNLGPYFLASLSGLLQLGHVAPDSVRNAVPLVPPRLPAPSPSTPPPPNNPPRPPRM